MTSSGKPVMEHTPRSSDRLSRRQFLKISAVAGGLLAGGGLLARTTRRGPHTVKETRTLMGTVINLALVTMEPEEGQRIVNATFAEMARLIGVLDHRRPEAALARLNADGHLHDAPAALRDVLQQALAYSQLSRGAFDVSVLPMIKAYEQGQDGDAARPLTGYKDIRVQYQSIFLQRDGMQLTLDGIAKGYIVDSAVALLRRRGFADVLVEAGGDLAAFGQRGEGGPWRVGIRHPRATASPLGTVQISQKAVATSGDYMNSFTQDFSRHHIVDPRSGISPQELSSVTVLAPTAMDADALSTTVMVLGLRDGMTLLERLPHVAGLLVSKAKEESDVEMWPTSNFPALDQAM